MSNIQYYRYELIPKAGGKSRQGALLHIDGGFSDLCPLPEFGDGTIDQELVQLANGEPSPLARVALDLASTDRDFRSRGRPFLAGFPPRENHALLPGLRGYTPQTLLETITRLREQGFRVFKVKVGTSSVEQEAKLLNSLVANVSPDIQLRLDPNARFTPKTSAEFLACLSPETRERIEFMEDPTPFDADFWRFLHETYHVPIAADFEVPDAIGADLPYQVRIVKPVRDVDAHMINAMRFAGKVVVTSALDHPLGQMAALRALNVLLSESEGNVSPVAGIASHLVYAENPFSAQLHMEGSCLIPPPGMGCGFDQLLEALPWTDLD
jgi:o-succinylbenzoate synthase